MNQPQQWIVVINDEEQYSIWRARRAVPDGWHAVGVEGTEQECLDHIERVWTDLRPRSLREHMRAREGVAPQTSSVDGS